MPTEEQIRVLLSREQINNLLIFLNRVDIKGAEARVVIDLIITLSKANQAQRIAPEKTEDKDGKK